VASKEGPSSGRKPSAKEGVEGGAKPHVSRVQALKAADALLKHYYKVSPRLRYCRGLGGRTLLMLL
jgi:hypothetical protein